MRTIPLTFTAGQTIFVNDLGSYFHLLETVAGIDIDFLIDGAVIASAKNMEAGFFSEPADGFTGLNITSATAQTVKIAVALGKGGYNRTVGSVSITNMSGAITQGRVSLTNVNQAIIAANAARRYLMVQNNDPVAVMRIKLNGNVATATVGFRVQPGAALELSSYCATSSVNCMMETATAAANNVEFASG